MSDEHQLRQVLHSGEVALNGGDWTSALRDGRTAVTLAPAHPGARSLLGLALLQTGQIADALPELEQATRLAKNNPAILGNLAQAYAMAGHHAEAHQNYRRAQRLAPAHWPYAQGAAIALAQQGRAAEAETLLQRLTARFPQESVLWYNLGNVQRDLHRLRDAERSYRAALRITPTDIDARLNLGAALHGQSQFAAAESVYRECIEMRPDWVPPRLNLISVLIDDGHFNRAEQECHALIARSRGVPEAYRFLGAALGQQGKMAQAIDAYNTAVHLAPQDPVSRRSFGGALAECGDLLRALRVLASADDLEPDTLALKQLLSMIYLAHGMFVDGWTAYRSRPAFVRLSEKWSQADITQVLPADLSGKQVLVRREQGLGDELFFLRQLPLMRARGARVTVYASAKIAELIRRAHVADEVHADTAPPPAGAELQIFCGDLPYALASCPSSPVKPSARLPAIRDFPIRNSVWFPPPAATLRIPALADAAQRMQDRLRQAGPPPYIGITWRAGTVAREQIGADWVLSKELPIAALGAALRGCPGTLIALQRHPSASEINALAAACGSPIADFTDLNEHLEDMLALLELLDDYVGVSNTNMHLRAAAGRTARVLVPNPAEWRWMQDGSDSPWFPGFRIYRQSLQGEWSPALDALARDLDDAA